MKPPSLEEGKEEEGRSVFVSHLGAAGAVLACCEHLRLCYVFREIVAPRMAFVYEYGRKEQGGQDGKGQKEQHAWTARIAAAGLCSADGEDEGNPEDEGSEVGRKVPCPFDGNDAE